ncbi:MAG: hypothetical protein AAF198_06310 [Pseudomonadota bacterium]
MRQSIMLAALMLTALSACSQISGPVTNPGFDPICISRHDALTEGTARQVLTHNIKGELLEYWGGCGD